MGAGKARRSGEGRGDEEKRGRGGGVCDVDGGWWGGEAWWCRAACGLCATHRAPPPLPPARAEQEAA
eukprot:2110248-Rhodomonas_salina.1